MKRLGFFILLFAAALTASAQIRIATPNTEMVLKAEQGKALQIQYFGARLSDADLANLQAAGVPKIEIERDGAKPDGVGVELADFCMRLLDYAAYRGAALRPLVVTGQKHCSLPHLALKLYKTTAFMCNDVAGKQSRINRVSDCVETMIADVAEWLNAQGCSLIDLIQMKMAYNKTRPALHGKRY